jgi:hypothetical protein
VVTADDVEAILAALEAAEFDARLLRGAAGLEVRAAVLVDYRLRAGAPGLVIDHCGEDGPRERRTWSGSGRNVSFKTLINPLTFVMIKVGYSTCSSASKVTLMRSPRSVVNAYWVVANTIWTSTPKTDRRRHKVSYPLLKQSSVDIVSRVRVRYHLPLELVELIHGKKVVLGAIDVATETVETPEDNAKGLSRDLAFAHDEAHP